MNVHIKHLHLLVCVQKDMQSWQNYALIQHLLREVISFRDAPIFQLFI